MRCAGLRFKTLAIVRNKVDRASLWNVMITDVGCKWATSYSRFRHLQEKQTNTCYMVLAINLHGITHKRVKDKHRQDAILKFYTKLLLSGIS